LCAGLPLALAIAAARAQAAPLLQLSDLADQLGAAQSTLDMLDGGDPASNLRAAFACSYQRLPVEDARMFRLLGLHPGLDIGVPAAASLTAMPRRRAQNILGRLADANLVTEHLPGRYTMHDLLRSYAREQAESEEGPDCRRATADRILDHYLHTSYEAMLLISRLPPWPAPPAPEVGVVPEHITSRQSALAWFEVEHQVLLGLLATAGDYDRPRHIWRIAAALGSSLLPKDRGHEAISVLTTGLQVAEASNDRLGIAHLHLRLGRAQVGVRCFAAAEEVLDLALREFEELGDLTGQGMCHQVLSLALELQGRVGQALPHSQLALEMFRSAGAVSEEAGALNGVGWLHMRTGDHQTGLTLCQQALALNTELGFLIAQAETWDSIGYAYHHLGHHARALTCYRSALRLHRESGRMYYVAETLVHIGETHQATGDLGSARQAWREALAILTQLEHPDARAVAARLEPARATGR
ncbi:MAG: tetratricopeptide repeat protein, partial [Micromonosporaceae bacterium]|nr:tetratricopeptide repeat protein [Micromonosporaceae bacterium]